MCVTAHPTDSDRHNYELAPLKKSKIGAALVIRKQGSPSPNNQIEGAARANFKLTNSKIKNLNPQLNTFELRHFMILNLGSIKPRILDKIKKCKPHSSHRRS